MAPGGHSPCSSLSLCLFATTGTLIFSVLAPGLSRQLLRVGSNGGGSLLRQVASAEAADRPLHPATSGGATAGIPGREQQASVSEQSGGSRTGDVAQEELDEIRGPSEAVSVKDVVQDAVTVPDQEVVPDSIPATTRIEANQDVQGSAPAVDIGSLDAADVALSLEESDGFVAEHKSIWQMRRWRQANRMKLQDTVLERCPTVVEKKERPCIPGCEQSRTSPDRCWASIFWQLYYEPSFGCVLEKRIGAIGDGGRWICDPHKLRDKISKGEKCLVYSIGDVDFKTSVQEQLSSSCEVHNIEDMGWEKYSKLPAPKDGSAQHFQSKSIPAKVQELGHTGRVIDILNIDCDGCEWHTFRAWFGEGVYIRQLLVRLHFTSGDRTAVIHDFFRFLFDLGYVIFHKEPNTARCQGSCLEYAFIRMSPKFSRAALDPKGITSPPIRDSHSVSLTESEGFIDESDAIWKMQGQRHVSQKNLQATLWKQCPKLALTKQLACIPSCEAAQSDKCTGHSFWHVHYEPSFSCLHEGRIGMEGEGGKWVCDPHKMKDQVQAGKKCLVYSIGSHGQYDFEESVHSQISPSCEIHTVDMKHWSKYTTRAPPTYVNYHVYTVGPNPPATNIPSIVSQLGHKNRVIDIFKIDCEGCEWFTFKAWFGEGVYIRQVLVELHWDEFSAPTRRKMATMHEFFSFLFSLGYVIFHKEPNTLGCKGKCIEYAFVKMSPTFAHASS